MQKPKRMSIECVNRVKLEQVDDFQESIFCNVYQAAHMQVEHFMDINSHQAGNAVGEAEKFCNGNEMSNVISFVGERGMGKSSAMLSFAYFLKQYPGNISGVENHPFQFEKHAIKFHTLSKVDVAILTNESLFDVVLAKMWMEFSEKTKDMPDDSFAYSHTKESFNSIKDVYNIYYKDEKQNKNLTSVSQLQKLARSLALKEQFAELVISFLEYMVTDMRIAPKDRYLVIPIDDLDLADDKTLAILEQLRIFLSVPQVIVLTTVDIEKLLMCGTKKFTDELISRDNVEDYEKNHARQYSDQYIAKVLPRNSRIYMPKYGGNEARRFALEYDRYVKKLMAGEAETGEDVNYFTFIDMVVSKHLNLIIRYQDNLNLGTESLRNIVNKTYELWMICQRPAGQARDFALEWLDKEVQISANRIYDLQSRGFIDKLFTASSYNFNEYIINYFTDESHRTGGETSEERYGYGQLLCTLAEWRDKSLGQQDLLKELLLFYSLQIEKCLYREDYEAIENFFVRDDIFSSCVYQKVFFTFEDMRLVDALLRLNLKCSRETDSAQEIMAQNSRQIADAFKGLLFCDIEQIMAGHKVFVTFNADGIKKIPLAEEAEKTETISVRTRGVVSRISIDNFFRNIIRYRELFEKYILWLYGELRKFSQDAAAGQKTTPKLKKVTQAEYKKLYDSMAKGNADSIRKMAKWKNKFQIKTVYDLLPIQNVGVMLGVLERLGKKSYWGNFDQMISEFSEAFVEEFEEAEQACAYEKLGYYKYSEKFRELMKCIRLDLMPDEIKDSLIVTGQILEDTAWLP